MCGGGEARNILLRARSGKIINFTFGVFFSILLVLFYILPFIVLALFRNAILHPFLVPTCVNIRICVFLCFVDFPYDFHRLLCSGGYYFRFISVLLLVRFVHRFFVLCGFNVVAILESFGCNIRRWDDGTMELQR